MRFQTPRENESGLLPRISPDFEKSSTRFASDFYRRVANPIF